MVLGIYTQFNFTENEGFANSYIQTTMNCLNSLQFKHNSLCSLTGNEPEQISMAEGVIYAVGRATTKHPKYSQKQKGYII